MKGRIEQENKIKEKIRERLSTLPSIFSEFYNYMEADQKSYSTMKHYIEYVNDFMDVVAKENNKSDFYKYVTVPEIREYMVTLRRRIVKGKEVKNSDSIQAQRWSALNTFFDFLVMDDYIDINPMAKTRRPKTRTEKPVVYLEQNEINIILDKIRQESKPQFVNRDLAIMTLGIGTGIRVGALVQIDIDDVNFKDNTVHVIEKGNKERYLKFGTNTRNALSAWLIDRSTYFNDVETNALFISQWKKRLSEEGVRKFIKKYADGISGKHITPHNMRKSTATNAIIAGADIQTVADMLGHQNIQTTRRYAAILSENKQKATDTLDAMF